MATADLAGGRSATAPPDTRDSAATTSATEQTTPRERGGAAEERLTGFVFAGYPSEMHAAVCRLGEGRIPHLRLLTERDAGTSAPRDGERASRFGVCCSGSDDPTPRAGRGRGRRWAGDAAKPRRAPLRRHARLSALPPLARTFSWGPLRRSDDGRAAPAVQRGGGNVSVAERRSGTVSGRRAGGAVEASTSSSGHLMASAAWLDLHFADCRPEYEAMLRAVGIAPGWRVLDAGCGSGGFMPLLAALVGPGGRLAALDLAPENVAAVRERTAAWRLPCPVAVEEGSLLALPYPDGHFDAAWCANVSQYLTDAELATALAELRRVVRPGGLVAVKEVEPGHWLFAPGDPATPWRLLQAARRVAPTMVDGQLRARALQRWLARAGLVETWQRTTLAERSAPLAPLARRYAAEHLRLLGESCLAAAADPTIAELLAPDLPFWRAQLDPDDPAALVNHPDFYRCEGAVVAVGRVPGGA